MGTPCDPVRERFSELYEDTLPVGDRADVKSHVDSCAACRVEFSSFVRATDALARLGNSLVRATPPAYVASVMKGVDLAAAGGAVSESAPVREQRDARYASAILLMRRSVTRRRRFARAATHVAAGAIGALVVWLLLGREHETTPVRIESTASTPVLPRISPPPVDVVKFAPARVTGDGVVLRNGHELAVDRDGVVLEPGDVLKGDPGASLALALGNGASIRLETAATPAAPAPEPRVIEKPVETIRYVNNGPLVAVDIDRELVDEVVKNARARFEHLKTELESMQAGAAESAPSHEDPHDAVATAAPPAAEPSSIVAPPSIVSPPAPVVVRREGDLVTLETRGPLVDVVPALLAKLDDSDPRVRSLVIQRLETIESDLKRDPNVARRLREPGREAQDAPKTVLGTVTGLFRDQQKPALDTPEKRWAAWWSANSNVVIERDTWGTW